MKKGFYLVTLSLLLISLTACSNKNKEATSPSSDTELLTSSSKTEHEDVRLNFNKIVLAQAANEFKGGTTLEELKAIYGEPTSQSQTPAGDVTLDSYTWNFDSVVVTVQLFENSSIARSISNFVFSRKATIDQKMYDKLENGMTFKQAIEILGEPDDFSQAVSSDKVELQAMWVSGFKSESNSDQSRSASITLSFENDALTQKSQTGLNK